MVDLAGQMGAEAERARHAAWQAANAGAPTTSLTGYSASPSLPRATPVTTPAPAQPRAASQPEKPWDRSEYKIRHTMDVFRLWSIILGVASVLCLVLTKATYEPSGSDVSDIFLLIALLAGAAAFCSFIMSLYD